MRNPVAPSALIRSAIRDGRDGCPCQGAFTGPLGGTWPGLNTSFVTRR
jgi:hypothetical protein